MELLGKIQRVNDLRTIWPHEARDFSKWLSLEENLEMLSDAIEIDIVLDGLELESPVGGFNVDLYALEEGTGRKIVIENQLEDTNHDHLGKIITYASGKGAEIIVWIVKKARDEHRQAVEWLNQNTLPDIGFFLLEIELWRINDSLPAPKFNVVEKPNNWTKNMRAAEGLSESKKLKMEYWQAFVDYAFSKPDFKSQFNPRKAHPHYWYNLSVGSSSMRIALTANTQKNHLGAEIYFNDNKELYEKFLQNKEAIELELGIKPQWRVASKDCRILVLRNGDITNGDSAWNEYFNWYIGMAVKLKQVISKYTE